MKTLSLLIGYLACLTGLPQICLAQSPVYSDAGSWNTLNFKYFISKPLVFVYTQELRFRENYSRLNLLYTDVSLEYRFHSKFRTSLSYRCIQKLTDENNFSIRHRLSWDFNARQPWKKWTASYRHRLQAEVRNIHSSENGRVPEWYSRHKFDLSFNLNKKITPYLSTELRWQITDPRNVESDETWHRIRYIGGVDYEPSRTHKFGVYYLMQREWNVSQPEKIFITGLEYTYTLRRK